MKITFKNKNRELDYKIIKWIEAGLDKQSYVRVDKKIKLPLNVVLVKKGTLQKVDIDNIKILCDKYRIKLNENFN